MGNYKVHELATAESIKVFMENFLEAVLELHNYNQDDRAVEPHHHLALTNANFVGDGPGYVIVRYIHGVMLSKARIRTHQDDADAPPEFTHVYRGYILDLLAEHEDLKGYNRKQLGYLSKGISGKLLRHRLIWKRGSGRAKDIYLRAWPSDLVHLDPDMAPPKRDYRDEKRITEMAVVSEETLKVYLDINSIPLPSPDDPMSFVRYVKALRSCYEKLESRYEKQTLDLEELQLKVEEMEKAKSREGWEHAAAEIEAMTK